MLNNKHKFFVFLLLCAFNGHAVADSLSTCLADSTTGRDRKDLAVWVFTAISSHPEIQNVMPVNEEDKINSEKKAGEIYTRLIAEDCKAEILASQDSPLAIKKAFEKLGKIAMMELLNDTNVTQSIQGVAKYMDHKKIEAAIKPAAESN